MAADMESSAGPLNSKSVILYNLAIPFHTPTQLAKNPFPFHS